jgi:alpha-L-rhamnosidase
MAAVLDMPKEAAAYQALARRIRTAFNRAFVSKSGKIKGDTQAGYALALSFDLLPARLRPAAARHMIAALAPYDGALSTGIQSTVRMMIELSRRGHHDIACALATRTAIPSWGYMVEHGGTTIWERWDGFVEGRGYQNPGMNSFNHYAIGAVGEWMYRTLGGLEPDEARPGWKHFTIRPMVPAAAGERGERAVTWVKASYRSARGMIASAWRVEGNRLSVDVTVPASTTATIVLPTRKAATATEGGRKLNGAEGVVKAVARRDGLHVDVLAGRYAFACQLP